MLAGWIHRRHLFLVSKHLFVFTFCVSGTDCIHLVLVGWPAICVACTPVLGSFYTPAHHGHQPAGPSIKYSQVIYPVDMLAGHPGHHHGVGPGPRQGLRRPAAPGRGQGGRAEARQPMSRSVSLTSARRWGRRPPGTWGSCSVTAGYTSSGAGGHQFISSCFDVYWTESILNTDAM